jgi:acetylornithine deacetylase
MLSGTERKILDAVDGGEIRRLAVEAARIPSYAPPTGQETELAEFFAAELRRVGLEVVCQQVAPGRPNVLGYLRGGSNGRSVLFNGHLDTTPPVLGWTREPYGGVVEGDRLYGHGVSNMKASDVAMVGAVSALARAAADLAGEVIVSLVVGECRGGQGTTHMLREGVRADCFINGEPTDLRLSTLHAGICQVRLVTRGRTHHFGTAGHGINAIEKMLKVLLRLGDGPSGDGAWPVSSSEDPAYAGFPRFNLGAIRGGLTTECLDWGPYMTPDYCAATLDVRFPPGLTRESICEDLRSVLRAISAEDPDLNAEVEPLDYFRVPFETRLDAFPVPTVLAAATIVLGRPPAAGALSPIKFMGGDASLLQGAGIPGIVLGVGTFTSSVPDEYVELSKTVELAKIYALAAYRLARE